MGVGAAGHDVHAAVRQRLRKRLRIGHHGRRITFERGRQRLAEGHGLRGYDMHQRAPLKTGENGRIDLAADLLVI